MIYAFDIDGTICSNTDTPSGYENALPWPQRINIINKLYDAGHTIYMFTARGTTTGVDYTQLTKNQLKEWGVKYHQLIMGKPFFNLLVDDRAISAEQYFQNENLWR